MEGVKTEDGKTEEGGMPAIKERLRPHLDENPVAFKLEKWLQIHGAATLPSTSTCPTVSHAPGSQSRSNPRHTIGHRRVPEVGQYVCQEGLRYGAERERRQKRIASHLHVPAQVVQAARWQIPTLVLIRRPRDAVLSFALWNPISVDQALRYYISFYETAEKYRDAYVLGLFEEITEDFGQVIKRINDKFGTTFSLFRHNEEKSAECLPTWTHTPEKVWRDPMGA